MATAALVLAVPPEVVPPHAATTSTVAMANARARPLRVIRLPPCFTRTRSTPLARGFEQDRVDAIGNRMLGQESIQGSAANPSGQTFARNVAARDRLLCFSPR